jgi:hypothetical protein
MIHATVGYESEWGEGIKGRRERASAATVFRISIKGDAFIGVRFTYHGTYDMICSSFGSGAHFLFFLKYWSYYYIEIFDYQMLSELAA